MKQVNIKLLSLIIIPILFYYFFGFNIYTLLALILGLIIGNIILTLKQKTLPSIIIAIVLIYLFAGDVHFITSVLVGVNIATFYFYIKPLQESKNWLSINLLNAILIANILFQSSVEKFRGFNKLTNTDLNFTIPIIVLVGVSAYFLLNLLKNYNQKRLAILITLLISIAYYLISFTLFKEIGTVTIFIPLLCGVILGVINVFVKKRPAIIEINEIALLLIIPYQIAGLLGVALAFLSALVYINSVNSTLGKNEYEIKTSLSRYLPILFLFASSEINENKGIITRFNLATGYQTAWLIIVLAGLEYGQIYFDKLSNILKENEISQYLPLLVSVFTILAITIIIKFGGDESLSSLLISSSLYLFLTSLLNSKKQSHKLQLVSLFGNIAGALAFWIFIGQ